MINPGHRQMFYNQFPYGPNGEKQQRRQEGEEGEEYEIENNGGQDEDEDEEYGNENISKQ